MSTRKRTRANIIHKEKEKEDEDEQSNKKQKTDKWDLVIQKEYKRMEESVTLYDTTDSIHRLIFNGFDWWSTALTKLQTLVDEKRVFDFALTNEIGWTIIHS